MLTFLKIAREERLSFEQMYLMIALIETPEALVTPEFSVMSEDDKARKLSKIIRREEAMLIQGTPDKSVYKVTDNVIKKIIEVRDRYENSRTD